MRMIARQLSSLTFQYPKVRLKVLIPDFDKQGILKFQYPKVRLKALNKPIAAFDKEFQYPKVRLKVVDDLNPPQITVYFNTRRCD